MKQLQTIRAALLLAALFFGGCAAKRSVAPVVPPQVMRNTGQLDGACSMVPDEDARPAMGVRLNSKVSAWLCGMTNNSPNPVAMTETPLDRALIHLHPIGTNAMSLLVSDGDKHAPAAVLGRVSMGIGAAMNVAATTKTIRVPTSLAEALAYLISYGPTLVNWAKGVQVAVAQSVAVLSPGSVVSIQPGATGSMYFFTAKWAWTPQAQEFSIQVTNLPVVKLAQ